MRGCWARNLKKIIRWWGVSQSSGWKRVLGIPSLDLSTSDIGMRFLLTTVWKLMSDDWMFLTHSIWPTSFWFRKLKSPILYVFTPFQQLTQQHTLPASLSYPQKLNTKLSFHNTRPQRSTIKTRAQTTWKICHGFISNKVSAATAVEKLYRPEAWGRVCQARSLWPCSHSWRRLNRQQDGKKGLHGKLSRKILSCFNQPLCKKSEFRYLGMNAWD